MVNAGFIDTYKNLITGAKGHPALSACPNCTDEELIAAVKYMMTASSVDKNFELW